VSTACAAGILSMMKHLLVDLENVQPTPGAVAAWMGSDHKAWIFYGPHQKKLLPSFEALGPRVTLVPIFRPGENSLDFHLVLYLGYLAAGNPASEFTVLAKDKGYDPAIAHARLLKLTVKRISALRSRGTATATKILPAIKLTPAKPAGKSPLQAVPAAAARQPRVKKDASKTAIAVYRDVLADLREPNRPGSLAALERHIQSRFGGEPVPDKVASVVGHLQAVDAIKVVNGRLVYLLQA
jgi:hypothetical protein